jgi:hypothetical protein
MNKREYSSGRIVFLLDVDNTLLDNDGVARVGDFLKYKTPQFVEPKR